MRTFPLLSTALLAGFGLSMLASASVASAQTITTTPTATPTSAASAGSLVLTLKAPASYSIAAPDAKGFVVTVTLANHLQKPIGVGYEEPRVTYELIDAQKQTVKPMLTAFVQHGMPRMTPHFIRLISPGESATLVSAAPLDVSAAKPGLYQLRADYSSRFGGETVTSNWVQVRITR